MLENMQTLITIRGLFSLIYVPPIGFLYYAVKYIHVHIPIEIRIRASEKHERLGLLER